MSHLHESHTHQHNATCGHAKLRHNDHFDYLHDGHLHHQSGEGWEEHQLEVNDRNPDVCQRIECTEEHQSRHMVPHGDHFDFVVNGRLHHEHDGHCDDHGPVEVELTA